jgi:trimeric autotransporter adhesin
MNNITQTNFVLKSKNTINNLIATMTLLLLFSFSNITAQTSGIYESYAIINANATGNVFYDLSAVTTNVDFQGANLGSFTQAQTLVLAGGQNKTYKCSGGNITGSNIYYRVYPVSGSAGSFSSAIAFGFGSNDSGGCGGNQTWTIATNTTNVKAGLSPGVYYLEVYTDAPGTPSTAIANNSGSNYKATFTVSSSLSVYDFTGGTTGAATTNTTGCTLSNMTSNNNNGTITAISSSSPSSAYTGASGTNNIGNAPLSGVLNTATSGYYEFTITPPVGGSVLLSSITFGSRGTGTAPTNYAIRTSADSYGANIGSGALATSSTWVLMSPTISTVTGAVSTALTVRIYGYGGSGAAANTIVWRIDDINFVTGLTYNPALAATSSSLAFSTSQTVGSPTVSQTFNLSGSNLSGFPNNITVSAPNTDFQVSNNNSTWGPTTTIAYTTASLSVTAVYVRFNPQSSGVKTGNVTFSGGGVSTPPTVVVTGTAVLGTPVATAATNIAATSFDANWGAVTNATSGYLLDVSTSPTFGTTGTGLTNSFDSVTFPPTGWYNNGWSRSTTAADINSGAGAAIGGSNSCDLTTSQVSYPSSVSFYLGRSSNTTAKTLTIEVSTTSQTSGFVTVATYDHSNVLVSSYNQYTVSLSAYTASPIVYIRFNKTSTTTSPWRLDDVVVTAGNNPDYVAGYQSKSISGQSTITSSITGLTADTAYYYRLRATDGTPSAYSNVITVNPASRGGSVIADQTICSGTAPANLTLAGNNGTVIKWQSSTNSSFTSPIDIANTSLTLTGALIGNLMVTTYFRAVVQSFTNPTANSGYVTITVLTPISYANLQYPNSATICSTDSVTAYGQVYQAGVTTGAGQGAGITVEFGYSTSNTNPSTWTNWSIASYNTPYTGTSNDEYLYTFTPPSATTYYYTFRYKSGSCIWFYGGYNSGGGGFWDGSANVNGIFTVNNPVTPTFTAVSSICSGASLSALPTTSNNGITGSWSPTLNNSTTTLYTFTPTAGQCATTATLTITVNPLPTVSVTSNNSPICEGSDAIFSLTGTTGAIVTYNINGGASSLVTLVSGTATVIIPNASLAQTINLISVSNGSCTTTLSSSSTVSLGVTTTYTSAGWDNGDPTNAATPMTAIISSDFISTGDFNACTLTVNSNAIVTIAAGHNVSLFGALTVTSGTFTLSNNSNLIQSSNAANSGNILVNRDSNSLFRQDYTIWSSPVTGVQTLKTFSPQTLDAKFYNYNTGTNLYNAVASPSTTTFSSGSGYLIRTPNNSSATVSAIYHGIFPGVANNGNVPVATAYSGVGFGFNMVGNPYPSTISADLFISANTANIKSNLYFWRKTNAAIGSAYAMYNSSGPTATATSGIPNGVIQVGQGFLVDAKNANGVTFTNAMRIPSNSTQFFKNSTVIERNRVWLNLTNTTGAFSQMLVSYMTDATQGIDEGIDGKYINDSPIALTSNINNEEYTIQGRPLPFSPADIVPLNFKTDVAGNYTIALDHFDGLFSTGQDVFLRDNLNGTVNDLKTSSYNFVTISGNFGSRFELLFQNPLAVNANIFNENSIVVYDTNQLIHINSGSLAIDNLKVFDIRGRLLIEKKNVNSSETTIDSSKFGNQVLIVQITSQNGIKVSKKVIN